MKKQILLYLIFLLSIFNVCSQTLTWNQCNMINAGSASNFNYSKTFTGVSQSSTDVQINARFLACSPYATNTAGIKLNGTTFIQTNSSAGNCSYADNVYTIPKLVFNQAVIAGSGTIVFSCYIRDTCVPGFGCSFTSDPCIQMTSTYTTCAIQTTPTFTQVAPICSGATLAPLPVDSINGINGIWSPAMDNTATTTYTFTPAEGQCATTTTMTIELNPNVTPTFTQAAPVCSGTTLALLPVDSNNGINGIWSPAMDNTATTTYTFTPADGQCATATTMTVEVNPNVTPSFLQLDPICAGTPLAALPVDSINGINGSWTPEINNAETTLYTFTPALGQCASSTTMNIVVNQNVTPTFTAVASICSGATLVALPVDSNNGINGIWTPAVNNTETTSYIFTPASGQCASSATMDIAVIPNVTPVFTQVDLICNGELLAALPVDSTNGINGAWSPFLNNTTTTTYTFTPAAGQCATVTEMTIAVNQEVLAPTGSATQTFCDGETVGNIIVDGTSVVWYDAPTLGNIVPNTTVLVAGTTYYAAQSIAACQSNSRLAVTVSNGTCLAMDTFEKEKIKLYPNPIKNTLNISNNEAFTKVIIYNTIGQEVIVKNFNAKECSIDTSTLAAGSYMVKIFANNKSKTIKVIKE